MARRRWAPRRFYFSAVHEFSVRATSSTRIGKGEAEGTEQRRGGGGKGEGEKSRMTYFSRSPRDEPTSGLSTLAARVNCVICRAKIRLRARVKTYPRRGARFEGGVFQTGYGATQRRGEGQREARKKIFNTDILRDRLVDLSIAGFNRRY